MVARNFLDSTLSPVYIMAEHTISVSHGDSCGITSRLVFPAVETLKVRLPAISTEADPAAY